MPSRDLTERLKAGELLIHDGGTGSELQRRGVDLNRGATQEELGVSLGYTPERYAECALEWNKSGAQVIGGCCATGHEHIEALHRVFSG